MVIPVRTTQNEVISPLVRLRLGLDWAYTFVTCWTERNCLWNGKKNYLICSNIFLKTSNKKTWASCRDPASQFYSLQVYLILFFPYYCEAALPFWSIIVFVTKHTCAVWKQAHLPTNMCFYKKSKRHSKDFRKHHFTSCCTCLFFFSPVTIVAHGTMILFIRTAPETWWTQL